MPTIPPVQTPRSGPQAHRHREMAESFGTDAARYDRSRQPYPQALVDRIAGAARLDVLDVGCGTGIVARQFLTAGCTVLGVEPDARMAEFARRSGVAVEVATFETWEAAGRSFDAVVAGTAWHWVDPVLGAVKAAQVLRPGGRLAAFWHASDLPAPLATEFAAVFRRVLPDAPFTAPAARRGVEGYQGFLDAAADGIAAAGAFGEPGQWEFDWERSYSRDEWLDQLPTSGTLTRLAPERLADLLDGIGAAIDAAGGSFTMAYSTVAVTALRANRV